MSINLALAQEVSGHAAAHEKTWCYPSNNTLRAKLARFHGQNISQRTLTRHLGALEAAGWIRRQCRHQKDTTGKWTFRSTLYVILKPCQAALRRLAKQVAFFLRFSRWPQVANSVTPSGYNSSAGVKIGPPPNEKRSPPPGWVEETKRLLAR